MSKIKHKTIIGAHVSVAGGIQNSIENAQRIGVEAIQIHGSSPRQWLVRQPVRESIEAYKKALKESGISRVFLHAPYLANLASPNVELRKKSM